MSEYREEPKLLDDDKYTFEDCQIVKKLRESDKLTERERLAINRLYLTYEDMVG